MSKMLRGYVNLDIEEMPLSKGIATLTKFYHEKLGEGYADEDIKIDMDEYAPYTFKVTFKREMTDEEEAREEEDKRKVLFGRKVKKLARLKKEAAKLEKDLENE